MILGAHTPSGEFVHVGNVGTGFSVPQRRVLQARLDEIARQASPFAVAPRFGPVPAYWVERYRPRHRCNGFDHGAVRMAEPASPPVIRRIVSHRPTSPEAQRSNTATMFG
ncbi:hypothetical protein FHY52_09840 [Nocardia nova]|nr:hypothetical protein [Nocardia nova]